MNYNITSYIRKFSQHWGQRLLPVSTLIEDTGWNKSSSSTSPCSSTLSSTLTSSSTLHYIMFLQCLGSFAGIIFQMLYLFDESCGRGGLATRVVTLLYSSCWCYHLPFVLSILLSCQVLLWLLLPASASLLNTGRFCCHSAVIATHQNPKNVLGFW